jgi:SAM-dependent methyltransferase
MPWTGQFSPELVDALLGTYGKHGDQVIDPFMGSGTVMIEAARMGVSSTGVDINPAAFTMARTYCLANAAPPERRAITAQLDSMLASNLPDPKHSLFGDARGSNGPSAGAVLSFLVGERGDSPVWWLLETLVVLLDFYKPDLTPQRVWHAWSRLRKTVEHLPFTQFPIRTWNCDARQIPVGSECADLILTSPPYINVFNYHQQYRASMEAIGWNLLRIARSEIGSNRKHRGNRFLTVIQYCLDMAAALSEMKRVIKPGGRIILVVGRESTVRKTRFFNAEIVARLATTSAGLTLQERQERVFRNKFGVLIYEDILHFVPRPSVTCVTAREIANGVLEEALSGVPPDAAADLRDALRRIGEVGPSPLYCSGA